MIFTCPDCKKEYDIDPAKVPPGKKGFKCNACGATVSLDAALQATPAQAEKKGNSKAFIFILVIVLLSGGAAFGYLYMEFKAINESGIAIGSNQASSEERLKELKEQVNKKLRR
ncbi:MAG: hypothetical protein GY862_30830 [Gammaproteobacteria bacterium]|nr:hypothetical protein [Gammaproteobacteria bacterium]